LTREIAQTQLEKEIERPIYGFKRLFSRPSGTSFTGKIANGSFKVIPTISGRNSFLPQIKGSIMPYLTGSLIYIKFKMHWIVIIFICAFCGGIGVAAISDLNKNTNHEQFKGTALIPFGMILFLIVFAIVEFKSQSLKAKNRLLEITEGELFTEPSENIRS
jgi:Na+/proline symporter